jgi:hypothetical protein
MAPRALNSCAWPPPIRHSVRPLLQTDGPPVSKNGALGNRSLLGIIRQLGDLSRNEYVLKRQEIEEELARAAPPVDPALAQAEALLEDFARLWDEEPPPLERRKLVATLLDRVWQDGGSIVAAAAVRPLRRTMQRLNKPRAKAGCQKRERRDSNPRPPA